MNLSVIEICMFCKEEMEKTFNEKFDIRKDSILDKVLYIIFDAFEIDYNASDEYLIKILENIKCMNLKKLKKDEAGNILENLSEDTINKIKQLCSLYCIVSYNSICNIVHEAVLYNNWEKIDKEFNEKNRIK